MSQSVKNKKIVLLLLSFMFFLCSIVLLWSNKTDNILLFQINSYSKGLAGRISGLMHYNKNWFIFGLIFFILFWKRLSTIKKAYIILAFLTLGISDLSSNVIKHLVHRKRPCITQKKIDASYGCSTSGSLPSAHASNAMAFFSILILSTSSLKESVILLIIPLLIGASRIIIGVHYPSDVLFGFSFGIIIGIIIYWLFVPVRYEILYGGNNGKD